MVTHTHTHTQQQTRWPWTALKVTGVLTGVGLVYALHTNGYNVSKTERYIVKKFKNLFAERHSETQAQANSKFRVALSDEVKSQLATYFLQLDIDKENGVRRSDAIELVKECKFNDVEEITKSFIQKGRGRTHESKELSGCSLQEFGEFFECVCLNCGFDRDDTELDMGLFEERQNTLVEMLKAKNKCATPMAFLPNAFISNDTHTDEATSEDNPFEILTQEIQTKKKTMDSLIVLKKRRGLSEAETSRLKDLTDEIKQAEKEIKQLKNT